MSFFFPKPGYSNVTSNIPLDPNLSVVQNMEKYNAQHNLPQNPPNPTNASTTALQSQLMKEQNARQTASILTSQAGLRDEPTTTSSLLTGI